MPSRRQRVAASAAQSELATALVTFRSSLGLPAEYPSDAAAEAAASARGVPVAPDDDLDDLRGIEFCTIDPAESTDLDQALHLASTGDGMVLHYAIADVPAFVPPDGALDHETRRRGQTLYGADGRIPLHPTVLSENAASLLPDVDRRAFVWRFELDAAARPTHTSLRRAVVRSRRKWGYAEAQAAIDDGSASEPLALLARFGPARIALERERGGASLNAPDEEIVLGNHGYEIHRRATLPIEDWNAQVSLLTGMAAAQAMLDAGVGILRTMPPAEPEAVAAFRAQTVALGMPWPDGIEYGEYLRTLDRGRPESLAVFQAATSLFRGASYAAFDGMPPEQTTQAAIGAPYTHVTAPLRRLIDRWSLLVCDAVLNGRPVPDWARASLPELPAAMAASSNLAGRYDSGSLDRVEAALLSSHIGEEFDAVVISTTKNGARVQLVDPIVTASVAGVADAPGSTVRVRVTSADIESGVVVLDPQHNPVSPLIPLGHGNDTAPQ